MTADSGVVTAADRLRELSRCLDLETSFLAVVDALMANGTATLDGAWGSSSALAAAGLARHAPEPLFVVLPRPSDVDDFCDDFRLFSDLELWSFPALESELNETRIQDDSFGDRIRVLKGMVGLSHKLVIATSIQSLMQPVPSRKLLAERSLQLKLGQRVSLEELRSWFGARRFHATTAVELPGEFSIRGGILDVFAPDWLYPARIEFFDDEVASLRRFDIATQRSLEKLDNVEITFLDPSADVGSHFAEHLPLGSWILFVELERVRAEGISYLERVGSPGKYHSVNSVMQALATFPSATAAAISPGAMGSVCRLPVETVERFSGEISRVRDELDRIGDGQEVLIVTQTAAEVQRLSEVFGTTRVASSGRLHFPVGMLRQGFRLPTERTVLISSRELFHRGDIRRPPRRQLGKAIDSFLDLRPGDLIVHLAHGIGRYRGMERLVKDEHVEDHLVLEFDGGTRMFVPAAKIDLIQKYVGGTRTRPSLAKIGGTAWLRQKKAAELAVQDLAVEMLELQAARAARPGITFGADSDWQREFDASFPYTETPDQLTAIVAIKNDMQRPRPMDRLLCGDVGFGKTEVAMRAAFKAIDNGYQVAVLAPTTILVEQHYQTFTQRMAEFPFEIGKLSRFCSTRDERRVLEGLISGQTDLVVGTHRLASRDVQFHNLGLVIIDEEQRFGVEVKERLKQLRTTVDVLTTTATPIPRTLHMALVGVRDISNLETPPQDRVPVETRVTRWNDDLIRQVILRELSRNGQIYFVHNRVHDIEVVANRLRYIVPEIRLRIGHGQMNEHELEKVMVDFVAHRFDLLLATTIVESGLDIPNANTMFIDEADRYGLADLHQLRGRVGRSSHRGYCYLLLDTAKMVTPNAGKRLNAIEEYSDMGAGFAIAMRDLEIRGAGNLLGTQQSGHIAAVGYELYCQLLEAAVNKLKNQAPKLSLDVEINLPGQAFVPDVYVPDLRAKIDLYRRLARIGSVDQIKDFRAELSDRFGKIPEPVEQLLQLAELKIDAAVWQVRAIHTDEHYLVLKYADRRRIEQLAKRHPGRLRIVDDQSVYISVSAARAKPGLFMEAAKSVLRSN